MADNEIVYGGIGDLRSTALLHREIEQLLGDRTDLRSVCLRKQFDGDGSAALKIPQLGVAAAMSAADATAGLTATDEAALVDGSYTLTHAHYQLVYEMSDLATVTAGPGHVGVLSLAPLIAESVGITATDLICALFDNLTTSVGVSGTEITVDTIYDAQFQLQASVGSGPFFCVLGLSQYNHFQASLRGEGGAAQWQAATAEQLKINGAGYKGMWNGIEFWAVDSVPTANGDSYGALFSKACFAFSEAPAGKLAQIPGVAAGAISGDSVVAVEYSRKPNFGSTLIVGHYFPAVSEAQDLAGVTILGKT